MHNPNHLQQALQEGTQVIDVGPTPPGGRIFPTEATRFNIFDKLRNKWTIATTIGAAALSLTAGPGFERPAQAATTSYANILMPQTGKWGSTASGQANQLHSLG
ncbi:MAG TPA: hypothetical protein VFB59_02385 [Candidatus Saccharimonadales bacterium]|nr:hypothetical protein [Candidatus Saccharimonadales bacterium]